MSENDHLQAQLDRMLERLEDQEADARLLWQCVIVLSLISILLITIFVLINYPVSNGTNAPEAIPAQNAAATYR